MTAKERIYSVVYTYLKAGKPPAELTSRVIAGESETNLALINYYFGSRGALLASAAGNLMQESIQSAAAEPVSDPQEKLLQVLTSLVEFSLTLKGVFEVAVEDEIRRGNPTVVPMVARLLQPIYPQKPLVELKMEAYRLILPLQVLFLHTGKLAVTLELDVDLEDTDHVRRFVREYLSKYL